MESLTNNPSMQELIDKLNEVVESINNSLPSTNQELLKIKEIVDFGSDVLASRLNSKLWYFKTSALMAASAELCDGDSCFVANNDVTSGKGSFEYWYIYKTDDTASIADYCIPITANPNLVAVKIEDISQAQKFSDLNVKVSQLNSRISNIIALPEGSTTADAELADIRISVDGTVYDSAGDAVRGQVTKLKNDLDKLSESNILYEKNDLTINSGNGGTWVTKTIATFTNLSAGDIISIHCGDVQNGVSERKCSIATYSLNGDVKGGTYMGIESNDISYTIVDGESYATFNIILARETAIDANINVTYNDIYVLKNGKDKIYTFNSKLFEEKIEPYYSPLKNGLYEHWKTIFLDWKTGIFDVTLKNITGNTYFHATLDVKQGEVYKIHGYSYLAILPCILVDDENNVINHYPSVQTPTRVLNEFEISIPKGVSKMYINAQLNYQDGGIGTYDMYEAIVYKKVLDGDYVPKELIVIGDSWVEKNNTASSNFTDFLLSDGFSVYNMGSSGTGYRRTYDENKAFYQRALNIPTDKGNNVLLFGSFNDLSVDNYNLGEIDSTDLTTICGCINQTIANIYATLPLANIMVVTPGAWRWNNKKEDENGKAKAYCDAIVSICNEKQIPVYNFYDDCNLRAWDKQFADKYYKEGYATNTTHPNDAGHYYYVYPKIRDFVLKNSI
jgi:hypothetical protein